MICSSLCRVPCMRFSSLGFGRTHISDGPVFGGQVRGVSIMRALLSGELRVLGNVDGTVRGLFVSRAEFQQFGRNERAREHGNGRTASEVARELCCSNSYVPGLVGLRLLDGRNTPTGWQISEQSIARFKKKYVSLRSIARETGNSAKDLKGHCAAKHIPMILVKNAYCETRQAFVPIRDRNAVLSFRPVHAFNKPQAANRNRQIGRYYR